MKTIIAVIAFVAGVGIAAVACSVYNSTRESLRQVHLLSDVHAPLRQCLDDITKAYDRGDHVVAERKTRLLQQRWSEYLDGGPPPEQFSSVIVQMGRSTTQPVP